MHTFEKYPQFINSDPRTDRTQSYAVSENLLLARYNTLLSPNSIKGMTVLDIGCCVGAAGAWALDNGAKEYVGIDIQQDFVNTAIENFQNHFSKNKWHIECTSFEDFFDNCQTKFDIVIAMGVIYSSTQYQQFIKNVCTLTKNFFIIESTTPAIEKFLPAAVTDKIMYPMVNYTYKSGMIYNHTHHMKLASAVPSLGAVKILAEEQGYELDHFSYEQLKQSHPLYSNKHRFGAIFKKTDVYKINSADFLYKHPDSLKLNVTNDLLNIEPETIKLPDQWKFDQNIAKVFVKHAMQHIPDYYRVIDLSIKVCKKLINDPLNNRIIDVGCATGETIDKLWAGGFCNLVGVDNSQAMLDQCQNKNAQYIIKDTFPIDTSNPYHAVLCNWTLHFVTDKKQYLSDIFHGLADNGFLVLTDKTVNDDVDLDLYHDIKKTNGVSDEEIDLKAKSVKNIMNIDDVDWYIKNLKDIGFSRVTIINAAPCFTTFLAIK
jgi:tRNA (cmo5U34)-methyltransferase